MKYSIRFKEDALADASEIANWYNEKKNGLGLEFLDELELAVKKIKTNPFHYQVQKNEIRQILLDKFPYLVMFEIEQNQIIIYSIIHSKRNPKKKFRK